MRINFPFCNVVPVKNFESINKHGFTGAMMLCAFLLCNVVSAQPIISSISQLAGAPGSTITISGSNFNATAANNLVFFGATQATVNSASSSSLNVTVPYGATYAPVTVDNTATHLTAFSQYPFLPDYSNSAYEPGTIHFGPNVDFTDAANTGLTREAVADLDGDGKPDVIVVGSTLSVYHNIGSGGGITASYFAAPLNLGGVASGYYAIAVGDIDGDGKPDLVVGSNYVALDTVYVFRNTSTVGSISFAPPVGFAENAYLSYGGTAIGIVITDIDGDGKADVVTSDLGATVSVFRNTATAGTIIASSLATPVDFTSTVSYGGVAVGDLDGDGKTDVAVAGDNAICLFRNISSPGTVNFGTCVTITGGPSSSYNAIVISDIDGDGKPDIAVAGNGQYDDSFAIFRNTATPGTLDGSSLAAPVNFLAPSYTWNIAAGDFDGDGKPDLAVVCWGIPMSTDPDPYVSVYRNTSIPGTIDSSSMTPMMFYANHSALLDVAVGDLNGDGEADIITVNTDSNNISILQNEPLYTAPTISMVSPLIDSPGASVTITGTGFNTTATNDAVYFGATRATVNSASATSLNVTVPAGATYAPVTVNNTPNGQMAYSQYPFLPDFNNNAYAPGVINFDPQVAFTDAVDPSPGGLLLADIDGDGKPDLVAVGGTLTVYRNISSSGSITSGSFAAPVDFNLPGSAGAVAAGDIDGDGKPDIVIGGAGNMGLNDVFVLRNTSTPGSISFDTAVTYFLNYNDEFPRAIAVIDVDGDGRADVVTANPTNVSVLHNQATVGTINAGSLDWAIDYPGVLGIAYAEFYSLSMTDIDGDGKPDAVIADGGNNVVWVFLNTSTRGSAASSFATPVSFVAGNFPNSAVVTDIDGDGKPDLAVANMQDSTISLLRNTSTPGTVSFSSQVVFNAGPNPWSITAGDFNGDGKPDLAATNSQGNTISVFRNTATSGVINAASLATPANFASGNYPGLIIAGDIDGDGKADMAEANAGVGTITILRDDPVYPFPTITLVSPIVDSPGTNVTITGTGFNTTATDDIVYFGATRATVNSASGTSLNVTVPVGATYAPVTVNNTFHSRMAFSPYSFLPDYNNSAYLPGTVKFDAHVDFNGSGSTPLDVVIADIDGDGKPDMVAMGVSNISVYLNTSTSGTITSGSFASPVNFTIPGGDSYAIAAGDIDGDGKPDVVVTDGGSDSIFVLRNTSTVGVANFAPAVSFIDNVSDFPTGVAIMDVDGDGRADIVTANGNGISVFLNIAAVGTINAGSLAPPVDFLNYSGGNSLAVGDIDGDGKPDVAVTDGYNNVWVYKNTCSIGVANFGAPVNFTTGSGPFDVIIGDIDGDGKPDLAVVNEVDNTLSLLRNTSTTGTIDGSSFAGQVVFATGFAPYHVSAGDFDGDGKTDLVVSNQVSSTVSIFRNTAATGVIDTSSLATRVDSASGGGPGGIAVCDIDGDHKADIITTNTGDGTLSVLRNDPLMFSGITGNASMCAGGTTALTDASVGGTWSSSNTSFATVGSTGIVNGVAAGTATISYVTGVTTATVVVTVNAVPTITYTGGTPPSYSVPTLFFTTTNDPTTYTMTWSGAASSYFEAVTNGSLPASPLTFSLTGTPPDGTYTGYLTVSNGSCTSSPAMTVTINKYTTGLYDPYYTSGCTSCPGPYALSYIDGYEQYTSTNINTTVSINSLLAATSSDPGTVTDTWTIETAPTGGTLGGFISGSTTGNAGTGTLTPTAAVTYIPNTGYVGPDMFTIIVSDGVDDPATTIVYVDVYGASTHPIAGNANVCIGLTTSLSDMDAGGGWSSGNTAIATVGSTGLVTGVATGTATITYNVADTLATVVVTVNGGPGTINGNLSVCASDETTASLSDNTPGGTWSSHNTGIAIVGSTGIVTGVANGTTTISYTTACGVANIIVTVQPLPAPITGPGISGSGVVCVGGTLPLSDITPGGTWSISSTTEETINSSGVITAYNYTGASNNFIHYTTEYGCFSEVDVNVFPAVTSITGSTVVCQGATTTLSDAGSESVWSSNNTSIATVGSSGIVMGVSGGTATITFEEWGSPGCVASATVTVNSTTLSAGTITGAGTVCVGSTTNLSDAAGGGVWSSSNGSASVGSESGVVTGVASGTATISYTVTNSCASTHATTVVTINNSTSAGTISGATSVNVGSDITLMDATGGGTWSASNGDATVSGGVVTGVTAGTVTISYAVTGSCGTAHATDVITVNGSSIPGINGDTVVCAGSTTSLSDATTGGAWSSGNIAVATVVGSTGIVTGVNAGTATISYTVGSTHATVTVSVNAKPGSIGGAITECAGAMMVLTDATAGGTWSSTGDATVSGSGTSGTFVAGAIAGTATVSYILPTGCYTTSLNTIAANPTPLLGLTTVCVGGLTVLSDASTDVLQWTSSNTAVATSAGGDITGVSAGTTIITYKILPDIGATGTGCMVTTVVSVIAQPAGITGNTGAVCPGSTISLTDGAGTWVSSNAAIAAISSTSGIVTGVTGGTAVITYSAAGVAGCVAKTTVTVSAMPTISGMATMCIGGTTALHDAVAGGTWSSGSGNASVSAAGLVTGVASGTAMITYTTGGGCMGTLMVTVSGTSAVISGNLSLCAGMTTTLSDASAGGTWSISGAVASVGSSTGVVSASTSYTGTATISYTTGGCLATAIVTVNANPMPIQGATYECTGITIMLSDVTPGGIWTGAGDAAITGAGSSATLVAGGTTGTATVTYTIGTGCSATMTNTIYTAQPITGNFNLCVGLVIALTDASPVLSWSSSSTAIATVAGPDVTGQGAGVATITFKSSGAGNCITTQTVTVNAMPVVTAINGPATISHGGSPVSISDATTGGIWTSSNTSVITLSGSTGNPIGASAHTTTGSSVITYAVTIAGCTTKVTKTYSASSASHPDGGGTTTVYAGSEVSVADDVTGGNWSSSDNGIATVDGNGSVTGIVPGNVIITHEMTGDDGTVSMNATNVIVTAAPAIINVLPNPNKGMFTVRGTVGSMADEVVTLEVTDLLGQVIYRNKTTAFAGKLNETITLSNALANGMYILNVQSATETRTFHFVIEQ